MNHINNFNEPIKMEYSEKSIEEIFNKLDKEKKEIEELKKRKI
jgi:hypothetical protein